MKKVEQDLSRLERLDAESMVIGTRQTVDLVEIGETRGRLAWSNGPAKFFPASEAGVAYRIHRVDLGGHERGFGSWRSVELTPGAPRMRVKLIERGDDHSKRYSPLFGDGWLVMESSARFFRFELDSGEVKLRFEMSAAGVGRPAYFQKMTRSSKFPPMTDPDEKNWLTYVATTGEMFAFRRGGPPPEPSPQQLGLKI